MARKGDKRRNRKQRDARRQAKKLNPETADPLKTETVDPVQTLLAPFADDIEKIKLEMLKTGYAVEFVLVSCEGRRELLLRDQDMEIVSLMRRVSGLPDQGGITAEGSSRRDRPWKPPDTDLFPPNFTKHLLDAGYDFGVQVIAAGLTHDESMKLTATNRAKHGAGAHINHDGPPNGTIFFVVREV